jgi:hypothetical protein
MWYPGNHGSAGNPKPPLTPAVRRRFDHFLIGLYSKSYQFMNGIRKLLPPLVLTIATLACASCLMGPLPGGVKKRSDGDKPPAAAVRSLAQAPFKDNWYGIYFQDEKVGYSHFSVRADGPRFRVVSDSALKLTTLKETNEVSMSESVLVRPDLTLQSFESRVLMNGKEMKVSGVVEGATLRVTLEADGERLERGHPFRSPLYYSSCASLLPALRGLKDGASYEFRVFNPERQRVETVKQEIFAVAGGPGPHNAVWRVNSAHGRTVINTWLNADGLPVMEKGRDGALITVLEDESSAKKFKQSGVPGKDLALDISLVKVSRKIASPEKSRFLKLAVYGVDPALIPSDHRQTVSAGRETAGLKGFEVTIRKEDLAARSAGVAQDEGPVSEEDLKAGFSIQADHPEIAGRAREIVQGANTDLARITKLVDWTAKNIRIKVKDSFTALSVLRDGEGECESHAKLYTAFARSLKIPTRVVVGLVYSDSGGFLYHAWAESYAKGWIAVDPTTNQTPADATHLKVASGDSLDDVAVIGQLVGKIKLEVLKVM